LYSLFLSHALFFYLGKLLGLLNNGQLDLSSVRFFVLDEADKLVNSDNLSSIKQIYNKCPGGGVGIHRLQVCFFSATLHSPSIKELADTICINPTWIDLKGPEGLMPETVHHVLVKIPSTMTDAEYAQMLNEVSSHGIKPILDDVHINNDFNSSNNDEIKKNKISQRIKEIKPLLLLKLINKFEVSSRSSCFLLFFRFFNVFSAVFCSISSLFSFFYCF
jgi:hypothetical protein